PVLATQASPTPDVLLVREFAPVHAARAPDPQRRRRADPFDHRQSHTRPAEPERPGSATHFLLLRLAPTPARRQRLARALVRPATLACLDLGVTCTHLLWVELLPLQRLLEREPTPRAPGAGQGTRARRFRRLAKLVTLLRQLPRIPLLPHHVPADLPPRLAHASAPHLRPLALHLFPHLRQVLHGLGRGT